MTSDSRFSLTDMAEASKGATRGEWRVRSDGLVFHPNGRASSAVAQGDGVDYMSNARHIAAHPPEATDAMRAVIHAAREVEDARWQAMTAPTELDHARIAEAHAVLRDALRAFDPAPTDDGANEPTEQGAT